MEEERLARLSKRKASELGEASSPRHSQRPKIASTAESSPSVQSTALLNTFDDVEKGQRASSSSSSSSSSESQTAKPSNPPRTTTKIPFPHGVVKKTWAWGQRRLGDDIKIEEVLQKHQLQMAVLSSFQWDEEWLLSKIDLARTKLILIAFAADDAQKEEMRSNVPGDRIRFCFPPMQTMGSMHSKLQLLKYEQYLRIVVPTGNLTSYDWGETGTMENMVFIIDLPRLETAEQRAAQEMTPFADDLFYFLRAQGLDENLVASLRNYDFSETSRYGFVHTIAGSHTAEEAWKRTGYCGLGRAVTALGLGTSDPIEMDFVCASLGAVNNNLLGALYYACQGDSGLKEYELRTAGRKGKHGPSGEGSMAVVRTHTRVYFPSRETVLQSKGGTDGAGTICFQRRWWQAESFPHQVLHDCKSVREGLVMHSKILYAHSQNSVLSSSTIRFAYVGSANLSESAWGRLVKDRATGRPKLVCRNWECGVLVRVSSDDTDGPLVPIPMQWPSQAFTDSDASSAKKTPWFYQERG
ncbi:hypothetical protein VTK26DRAFT_448 [Humicola hyalothermophila]